jgi:RNA polymerase sigma factor (sigma-70 family)
MMQQTKVINTIFSKMRISRNEALTELHHFYFRTIYGVALSVCKDQDQSYDIVQNVMLRLQTLPNEKLPVSSELTWLYTVTKNEALQEMRRHKGELPLDDSFDPPSAYTEIDEFVDMDHFFAIISDLNERQKEIITLKLVSDMTYREIAQQLQMKAGTVRWIYSTAIMKLRTKMGISTVLSVILGLCFAGKLYWDLHPTGMIGISSVPAVSAAAIMLGIAFLLSLVFLFHYICKAFNQRDQ